MSYLIGGYPTPQAIAPTDGKRGDFSSVLHDLKPASWTSTPHMQRSRRATAQLALAACLLACSHAMPQANKGADRVHRLMEPAHPKPAAPRLKNPTAVGHLITPGKALMLMPAALVAMAFAAPDMLARLVLQVICFFGSLIEPFDPLLPEKGLLRTLVTTVKSAKRAWYIKQGLPDPSDTSFMDDDDDDDDDVAASAKPADEGAEETAAAAAGDEAEGEAQADVQADASPAADSEADSADAAAGGASEDAEEEEDIY